MSSAPDAPPAISVVTCCYNSLPFIRRLHASLLSQSYRNFEWVLVDDCSRDGTVSLLRELPSPGNLGMRVFRLPQNSGGGVALGLAFCAGSRARCDDHRPR